MTSLRQAEVWLQARQTIGGSSQAWSRQELVAGDLGAGQRRRTVEQVVVELHVPERRVYRALEALSPTGGGTRFSMGG